MLDSLAIELIDILRYNLDSEGGDMHDAYYTHRRKIWPPTHDRVEGELYKEGALLYGFGSPMLTVDDPGLTKGMQVQAGTVMVTEA